MDVATVIPAYRPRADHLAAALRSVEAQTVRPIEVIVVDDGSPDPVELPTTPLHVRLIRQANAGIAGARNAGIGAATAAVVHVLDQDDRVEPTFYERLLPAFSDPAIGVSFAALEFMADDETPVGYRMPLPGWSEPADWLARLLQENFVGSSGAVIRRDAWQQAGGYRDFRFVQDYRMWLDIARAGWRFHHHPEVLAWHRRHATQTTSDGRGLRSDTIRMLATVRLPLRCEPRRWRTIARHVRS